MNLRYLKLGKDNPHLLSVQRFWCFYNDNKRWVVGRRLLQYSLSHTSSKAHGELALIPKCSGHRQEVLLLNFDVDLLEVDESFAELAQ